MFRIITKLLPVFFLFFACKSQQPTGDSGEANSGNVADGPIEITKIAQGAYSGAETESQILIKSAAELTEIWGQINSMRTPQPQMPKVDFGSNYVLAAFMGMRTTGGFNVEIAGVNKSDNNLEVTVIYTGPGRGCMVTEAITHPYYLATVSKSGIESASFNIKKATKDCE